jgi:4-hydroxybenzoate polyprenyltransferase
MIRVTVAPAVPAGRLRTYLQLGRVSNLPTVWTNVLTGVVLAGGGIRSAQFLWLCGALTCLYLGGMFLNDAFDRGYDATDRPDRPIPSGRIGAREVFAVGYGLLAAALLIVLWTAGGNRLPAGASGAALAGSIIGYDAYHKTNPWSPWLMGLCRMLIYLTAALAVAGRISVPVAAAAAILMIYVAGLTFLAKRRSTPPQVVGVLIAGISLVDTAVLVVMGSSAAAAAALGFPATLIWQRQIRGT